MHIQCIGLNHTTSSVHLRERFTFTEDRLDAALSLFGRGQLVSGGISELVILSTCNRVEVYAAVSDAEFDSVERLLSDLHNLTLEDIKPHLYRLADEEAISHLFRVAAGLDSLVLGEPQILGQVSQAYRRARSHQCVGRVLSRLFHSAIHAGKRARSETSISHEAASIPSLAVRLAERAHPRLADAQVVVLGAGEMAELAIAAFYKRGVSRLLVVNRTLVHARSLAERFGGDADIFDNLPQAVQRADVLVASTSAPHTVLHADLVNRLMQVRSQRPLVVIDIAVPRDVDDAVRDIPNVQLYDLDSLHVGLEQSLDRRLKQVPLVEAILAEEQKAFLAYLETLDLIPVIAGLHRQAESIRLRQLELTLRRMPELDEKERLRLEAMTHAIVKEILHAPITRLRSEAGGPQAADYAALTRSLFSLDEGDSSPAPGA